MTDRTRTDYSDLTWNITTVGSSWGDTEDGTVYARRMMAALDAQFPRLNTRLIDIDHTGNDRLADEDQDAYDEISVYEERMFAGEIGDLWAEV